MSQLNQLLNQIKERTLSATLTAIILALLLAAWQLATDGGLVSALGGATNNDLKLVAPAPSGAVVAFDLPNGCPKGWSDFKDGQSRMIVGATFPKERPPKDEDGQPLSEYAFRQTGGKEQHTLQIKEMPAHGHKVKDPGHSHRVAGGFSVEEPGEHGRGGGELTNGDLAKGDHYSREALSGLSIESQGGDKSHPNMPPHVALYFCKKDSSRCRSACREFRRSGERCLIFLHGLSWSAWYIAH